MKNFKELLNEVKAFVFDVDGVMTDGSVLLMPDGEMIRKLNMRDGFAIQLAIRTGFRVAVITGTSSPALRRNLYTLGITDVYMSSRDKKDSFDEFLLTHEVAPSQILIMGNDLPDYEVMNLCELRTCPADAATEIRSLCQYVSPRKGGDGCVRDVIEQVLKAQGKWLELN
jgi:3-deoxy-D-manno-octulosonate 8-phosphate phosphatase (KDO 8-P phosphatase)